MNSILKLFPGTYHTEIMRPIGEVDILIGLDYAAFHPQMIQNNKHLVLYRNKFGKCLGGTYPTLMEGTQKCNDTVHINHFPSSVLDEFLEVEVAAGEKCDYSIKEIRELKLIKTRLKYKENCWEENLPWIRDPRELPNNKFVVTSILKSTERRLLKEETMANAYKEQMKDMFTRGVARKLSKEELEKYTGPIHYITHHEVLKTGSQSTPLRIVFNTSLSFHGHVLNEY